MKELLEAALFKACHALKQSPSEAPVIDFAKPGIRADYISNLPFALADTCQQTPLEIARKLIAVFPDISGLEQITVQDAGAIYFYLSPQARSAIIVDLLQKKALTLPDLTQSLDPVIQNTHTRLYRLLLQLQKQPLDWDIALSRVSLLNNPHEVALMQIMTRCFWLSTQAVHQSKWLINSLKLLALQVQNYLNEVDTLMDGSRYCLLKAVYQLLDLERKV